MIFSYIDLHTPSVKNILLQLFSFLHVFMSARIEQQTMKLYP